MLKIFLSAHGKMASGMLESLRILIGDCPRITVFDAFIDERSVQETLDAFYDGVADEDVVVLCSDLYGGSVNQTMYLYLQKANTYLVAGVNLPFILELAIRETLTKEELERMINDSREALRLVELDEPGSMTSEEFF